MIEKYRHPFWIVGGGGMRNNRKKARHEFSRGEKSGLYKAILKRRDVRGQFEPHPIPDSILARILNAAHHAGSVGFMQPWNFILIKDEQVKRQVKAVFEKANTTAAQVYEEPLRSKYLSMKLEGVLEAPLNICVTCDPTRGGPHVLGRHTIPQTDIYSTCCAIQNLWLAARVEGLGVGWVSILSRERLKEILRLPPHVSPVAYLCIGYPERFEPMPELEKVGWLKRLPLGEIVLSETWDEKDEA